MFEFIRKKIAIKLILIIVGIVSCVSVSFTLYINKTNSDNLKNHLAGTINKTLNFIKLAYQSPIWDYDLSAIDKLNEAVLNIAEVVAINIYEGKEFLSGYEKIYDNPSVNRKVLDAPYRISSRDRLTNMESGEFIYEDKKIGYFELYYTRKDIVVQEQDSSRKMYMFFILLSVLLVFVIYNSMKFLVVSPVIALAKTTQKVAAQKDYNVEFKKPGSDEISILYSGLDNMLAQIRKNEQERDTLYSTLQHSETNYRNLFERLKDAVDNRDYRSVKIAEFDDVELAESLNVVLNMLELSDRDTKKLDWLKTGQTVLSEKIGGQQKLRELCNNAINYIARYINAQIGAIYVKEMESDVYVLTASYAFSERKNLENKFRPGEGLAGQAVLEKERILFSEVPDDYVKISSSLGETIPKNILIVPLVFENDVKGVLEFGTTDEFLEQQVEFVDIVSDNIAVAINAALANERVERLLEQTQEQSEELFNQQKTLEQTNVELEEQTESLKKSEAKLQMQQVELRTNNEELQEKTDILEKQKQDIEAKNQVLWEKQKEIERKANQLEIATKYKSEFLANMSHELRTPLNSLLLLAKLLANNEERNLTEDQVESAASIYRSGQNLQRLINDILDLTKIEAGKMEFSMSKTRPQLLIRNIESEFKPIANEKKLYLKTEIKSNVPETIVTDMFKLEVVIRNLVGNAFKFTEQGGVTVTIFKPEDTTILQRDDLDASQAVAISVTDTGIGIPANLKDQVFDAFKQADGSISRQFGGTGLGLAISKELINLMGGELGLQSMQGEGSTFTVYLPEMFEKKSGEEITILEQGREDAFTEEFQTETADEAAQVFRMEKNEILVIGGNEEDNQVIADICKEKDCEYIFSAAGGAGIKIAIEHKPMGVVVHDNLTELDNLSVLKELKDNPDTRHIPVCLTCDGGDSCKKSISMGAIGCLSSPISRDEFLEIYDRIYTIVSDTRKELLLVEDNKELREGIEKLMSSGSVNVTAIESGEEAFKLLSTQKFDCMILDLILPDVSGFDLLGMINREDNIDVPPIIIHTGKDLSQEEKEKLEDYSTTIVLKSAASAERLLNEAMLFLHRSEVDMSDGQRETIQRLREEESVLRGKRVLIVDDDMRNVFALKRFLKTKGMEVLIAQNGEKALQLLDNHPLPNIVLMDIMMPVMDGHEAIRKIRMQERFKDLSIIAITAKAMKVDREECIRSGANDYLSKPVDISKLLSMLRVWIH